MFTWALIYFVFYGSLFALMGGFFAQLWSMGDAEPDVAQMVEIQLQMMGFQSVLMLGIYALQILLMAAVFRSVLHPEERRWAYLRFSARELWLLLAYLLVTFGLSMAAMVLIFPLAGIGALIGFSLHEIAGPWAMGLVIAPIILGGVALIVWLSIRFSMAFPMTFEDRTLRLFESWSLTRGRVRKLFLMFLSVVLIAIGIQLVLTAVCVGVLVAFVGPRWDALLDGDVTTMLQGGGIALALSATLGSLMAAVVTALAHAPLADAYRQLKGPQAEVFA